MNSMQTKQTKNYILQERKQKKRKNKTRKIYFNDMKSPHSAVDSAMDF